LSRAIVIVLTIIIFNVFMSFVASADFGETRPAYYESEYTSLEDNIPLYINDTSEESMDITNNNILTQLWNTLSFNWINTYTGPMQMEDDFVPVINGLNMLGIILIGIAILEIFWVKRDIY